MEKVIIISLIITAIHASTWPGMIAAPLKASIGKTIRTIALRIRGPIKQRPGYKSDWDENIKREYQRETAAEWIEKPLYNCVICMGGIWTFVLSWIIFGGINPGTIITALEVIGLNTILSAIIPTPE